MKLLVPVGIALGIVAMLIFSWVVIEQIANRKPPMQVVDFDFQGLRLGDPLPPRLTVKNPNDDSVSELIQGTKSDVRYTVLDGKVEALTIYFDDPYQAIEAYEKKFGVKATRKGDDAVWMTQHGEFVISKQFGNGRIASKKCIDHAVEYMNKKRDELGSKL